MIRITVLLVLALSMSASAGGVAKTTAAAAHVARDTYWYHPSGSACPAYFYNPEDGNAAAAAKSQCEAKTKTTCVSSYGSAAPAC